MFRLFRSSVYDIIFKCMIMLIFIGGVELFGIISFRSIIFEILMLGNFIAVNYNSICGWTNRFLFWCLFGKLIILLLYSSCIRKHESIFSDLWYLMLNCCLLIFGWSTTPGNDLFFFLVVNRFKSELILFG